MMPEKPSKCCLVIENRKENDESDNQNKEE